MPPAPTRTRRKRSPSAPSTAAPAPLTVADALAWRQQRGLTSKTRKGYARFRDLIFDLHFNQDFPGLEIAIYLKERVPSLKDIKPEIANSSIRRLINAERARRDSAAP